MAVAAGQKFGRWTLLSFVEKRGKNQRWLCLCDCGNEKVVQLGNIKSGKSRSCGCLHAEILSLMRAKHRMSSHPIYRSWAAMRNRCLNENADDFKWYGGRGIKVCEEWSKFDGFLKDMGASWKPGLTIERIDTNGNYTTANCRWATMREQSRNTRRNLFVDTAGGRLCLKDAAANAGVGYTKALNAFHAGVVLPELTNSATN